MRRRCCSGVFAERDKDLEQSDERAGELCGRPPSCDNAGSFRSVSAARAAGNWAYGDRTGDLRPANSVRTANYVLRARHGIGPPHPNGVDGRSGGAVSENGMDVSEEETSRARNAVAA